MARYSQPRPSLWLVAVLTLSLSWVPAWAGDPGLQQAKGQASTNSENPTDTLAALQAAFEAEPNDLRKGLALQDAYLGADKRREAIKLFGQYNREHKGSRVADFLAARLEKTGAKKRAGMRKALAAGLGEQTGPKGELAAWIEVVPLDIAASAAEDAAAGAARITELRGGAADWHYLGWIEERMLRNPDRAAASYGKTLSIDETHLGARNALAVLKANAGDKKGALKLVKEGVLRHPSESSAHLHYGLVQAVSGNPAAARVSYANALSRAGRDVDALASIASAYLDIEEFDLAEQALKRAREISPDESRVLTTTGLLALEQGDDKAAREWFKKAAKAAPRDARVAFLLGVSEERLGLGSKAIASSRRAVQLDPDRADYVTALGLALARGGSSSSAISKFKQVLKDDPGNAAIQMQLAITYFRQKKYRPALKEFEKLCELTPRDPRPYFYRAIILGDHLGKPKDAMLLLEAYAQAGGKEPSALDWLDELRAIYGK